MEPKKQRISSAESWPISTKEADRILKEAVQRETKTLRLSKTAMERLSGQAV